MKRLIVCILLIAGLAVFAGCSSERTASPKDVEFLTASDYWWFYDAVSGESEKMSFSEDFTFYWGCACGEPIGASDLYELYDYDKETQIITLYNDYDNTSMKMKVLDYNDYHILLEIDGIIKDYTSMEGMYGEPYIENLAEYLGGYNMYAWFIEGQGRSVVVGPYDYDGDIEYPDNAFKNYPLSYDIEFYDLQVTTVEDVDTGEAEQDVLYEQLTEREGFERLESGFGFIWFNDEMEIEKITFYGSICIQE